MQVILQVDFPYQGPWGDEMAAAMEGLAQSINQEPGFIWKIWTENQQTQRAGAFTYLLTKPMHKRISKCTAHDSNPLVYLKSAGKFLV